MNKNLILTVVLVASFVANCILGYTVIVNSSNTISAVRILEQDMKVLNNVVKINERYANADRDTLNRMLSKLVKTSPSLPDGVETDPSDKYRLTPFENPDE